MAASPNSGALNFSATLAQRDASSVSRWRDLAQNWARTLRVAIPGIVQSFNAVQQTVVVQPALQESAVLFDASGAAHQSNVSLPLLCDVPVVLMRAGGFTLTLPIVSGDECLVVFADMCIDAWWQSGGVQNQLERRRHDLSDAFALFGCWNQQRVLPSYSTTSAQLRNDGGTVVIDVTASQITVTAPTVNVTGSAQVNISGTGNTVIEGHNFLTHKHSGVQAGGASSGPVV